MISRIDHVSLAVRDYEGARAFFENILGAVSGASAEDSILQYFWHIFSLGDMSRLELITPAGENSFLNNFLKDKEGGVHHITLETPDIYAAKEHLEKHNIPYFGFTAMPDVWSELYIHPKDAFGVLIQIASMGSEYHTIEPVKRAEGKRCKVEATDEGCELRLHHPGGVELKLSLSREEMETLAQDLSDALEKQ
jgi:methylmalonyl-CoA/ethylmalonyl-CoA epimerase